MPAANQSQPMLHPLPSGLTAKKQEEWYKLHTPHSQLMCKCCGTIRDTTPVGMPRVGRSEQMVAFMCQRCLNSAVSLFRLRPVANNLKAIEAHLLRTPLIITRSMVIASGLFLVLDAGAKAYPAFEPKIRQIKDNVQFYSFIFDRFFTQGLPIKIPRMSVKNEAPAFLDIRALLGQVARLGGPASVTASRRWGEICPSRRTDHSFSLKTYVYNDLAPIFPEWGWKEDIAKAEAAGAEAASKRIPPPQEEKKTGVRRSTRGGRVTPRGNGKETVPRGKGRGKNSTQDEDDLSSLARAATAQPIRDDEETIRRNLSALLHFVGSGRPQDPAPRGFVINTIPVSLVDPSVIAAQTAVKASSAKSKAKGKARGKTVPKKGSAAAARDALVGKIINSSGVTAEPEKLSDADPSVDDSGVLEDPLKDGPVGAQDALLHTPGLQITKRTCGKSTVRSESGIPERCGVPVLLQQNPYDSGKAETGTMTHSGGVDGYMFPTTLEEDVMRPADFLGYGVTVKEAASLPPPGCRPLVGGKLGYPMGSHASTFAGGAHLSQTTGIMKNAVNEAEGVNGEVDPTAPFVASARVQHALGTELGLRLKNGRGVVRGLLSGAVYYAARELDPDITAVGAAPRVVEPATAGSSSNPSVSVIGSEAGGGEKSEVVETEDDVEMSGEAVEVEESGEEFDEGAVSLLSAIAGAPGGDVGVTMRTQALQQVQSILRAVIQYDEAAVSSAHREVSSMGSEVVSAQVLAKRELARRHVAENALVAAEEQSQGMQTTIVAMQEEITALRACLSVEQASKVATTEQRKSEAADVGASKAFSSKAGDGLMAVIEAKESVQPTRDPAVVAAEVILSYGTATGGSEATNAALTS